MAISSFSKNIVIKEQKDIDRFYEIANNSKPAPKIDSSLAKNALEDGLKMLKKLYSK